MFRNTLTKQIDRRKFSGEGRNVYPPQLEQQGEVITLTQILEAVISSD